jgi:hypothetical protein
MTEAEWVSTAAPALMLEFLGAKSARASRASSPAHWSAPARPTATVARSWDLGPSVEWYRGPIPGGRTMTCHELIETAERQADGGASAEE